ncbi:MAG: ABC transporter ATP-binding protein, partial [Treponema sp.]|nr:ABC transporter ATP-binding protein [Treponema sp.]
IWIQQIAYKVEISLMNSFYEKVLKIKYSFFEKHKVGDLFSRLNDVKIVRMSLSEGFTSIITNLIMFFVVGIALFYLNKILFIVLFIYVIALSFVILTFGHFFSQSYPISMEKYGNLQSFLNESFYGIEDIKTYPSYEAFQNYYATLQEDAIKSSWTITEKFILQNAYSSTMDGLSSVFIIALGILFVMEQKISLGQMVAFISLSRFFSNSVGVLLDLQAGIQEAFAAVNRIFEILDEPSESEKGKIIPPDDVPEIIFKNVNFSYTPECILYDDFSFSINSGEWISFVGETGCGKTTIAKLLLKLYTPQYGQILINGCDIQAINTKSIRSKIAYIPQEFILFSGTVLDNITMFDDSILKDDVIKITQEVGIYEKIMSLENDFNTSVSERGFNFSGGEKQKIAICRAIIKKPLIIILDEATSNLDTESEQTILQILQTFKRKKTIISIAHRLSSVKHSDKIYLLEKGKIIEHGNFEELKNRNGKFSKLLNDN